MLAEIRAGQTQLSDGTIAPARATRMGGIVVGDGQGRYYEQAARGNIFSLILTAWSTTIAAPPATASRAPARPPRPIDLDPRGPEAKRGIGHAERVFLPLGDDPDVGGHAGQELLIRVLGGHHHIVRHHVLDDLGRLADLDDLAGEDLAGE